MKEQMNQGVGRDYKIGLLERLQSMDHCIEYLLACADGGHEAMKMALADVLEAQQKALLDECENLRPDKKRLDWLERNATSVFMVGGEEMWCRDPDSPDWDLRQDIDHAMLPDPPDAAISENAANDKT